MNRICNPDLTTKHFISATIDGVGTIDFDHKCNSVFKDDDYVYFECVNFNSPDQYVYLDIRRKEEISSIKFNYYGKTTKEIFHIDEKQNETFKSTGNDVEVAEPIDIEKAEKMEEFKKNVKSPRKVKKNV